MLSDKEIQEKEEELKEMEKQLEQQAETEQEKAAPVVVPHPEPDVLPASDVNQPAQPEPIKAQESSEGKPPKDEPLEWAKKKGFNTPEDMARALLQKEREFHESRQTKPQAPKYQPQPQPEWNPQPDMGNGYGGYAPQPPAYIPRGDSFRELAAMYPQIDPEDLKRFMPVVIDAAQAISRRDRAELERKIEGINRTTERNNELMKLMQDPAFRDDRVQKEIHSILDSDPSIFQREREPIVHAYEKAMVSLARKQLQQGSPTETFVPGSQPPVTASGGNGSAFTSPKRITEREFDSWSIKDQQAFLSSNGRVVPKR